jgi:hypothetical protein
MGYRITIAAAARIKRTASGTPAPKHRVRLLTEDKVVAASSSIDTTRALSGTPG